MNYEHVYERNYDYEDLKIAICVSGFLNSINLDADYENIALITIKIKEEWLKAIEEDTLSFEQTGYVQRFAFDYLSEKRDLIMEELA